MKLDPRISVITLGVDDLERAAAFYEALGLERHRKFSEGVAFFQMGGVILSLFPRDELEKDAGLSAARYERAGSSFVGHVDAAPSVVLAYNTRTAEEVADVLALAEKAGGRIVKPAQRAFWGGTSGYFQDTEGNFWEVAHNPDFPLDAEGRISLPE
jgi:catechol 2,3-dioxygenase-like lactoylglutathione lyase family enzyme